MKTAISLLLLAACRVVLGAEILEGPESQVVSQSQGIVTFDCRVRGEQIEWWINDILSTPERNEELISWDADFTFSERVDGKINSTALIPTTMRFNSSTVRCISLNISHTEPSSAAVMIIAGPQLSPVPQLEVVSLTELNVSWDEPFTWESFPILSYQLTVLNVSSDNSTVYHLSGRQRSKLISRDSEAQVCSELRVSVSSDNGEGAREANSISGGFPVVPSEFPSEPKINVPFTADGTPKATLSFNPPEVCSFQEAHYVVKVFTAESSELVSEGNSLEIDNSATVVEAEISSGLLAHHHYYAELLYETQFVTLTTKIPFGPPSTPSHLSVPMNSVDVKSNKFSAVWNVPFTHTNHSVSHYTVRVSNPSQNQSYERSFYAGLERESSVQVSLQFPPHTSSCDILNISLTAVNDIGASLPASANIFIPKVPDVDLIATTTVHPESASSISIVIEIKFPEFCWFERVNYSVVLEEVSAEGSQVVQIENSVESPQETITETLSAGVVPNANYSVVVFAKTHTWNSSTAPHNFNPPNIPTTTATEGISTASPAVEGVSSGSESGSSLLLLGVVAGTVGFLLLLIAAVITVICVLRSRARNSDHPMCIEDMKVSSVPHEQITNPIYDGHLYEAVRDLPPQESLTVKPELHPLPPTTAESMYSESPTLSKRRQIGGVEEMEDAYVQMHTCKRK